MAIEYENRAYGAGNGSYCATNNELDGNPNTQIKDDKMVGNIVIILNY